MNNGKCIKNWSKQNWFTRVKETGSSTRQMFENKMCSLVGRLGMSSISNQHLRCLHISDSTNYKKWLHNQLSSSIMLSDPPKMEKQKA